MWRDLPTLEQGMETKRRPVVRSGVGLVVMAFQTLGIVYSDIGTSPLYVLNGIWSYSPPAPPDDDVIGAISAIVWALTILPLVKYTIICMHFGTGEGEGGTFALLQGLYPKQDDILAEKDRSLTKASTRGKESQESVRGQRFLSIFKWPLTAWSLFGTALTFSDGIFTAAVSVTSAVGGIAVAKPSVINDITPIAIAFLVALFLVQRFGTHRITAVFAPITFVWLVLLAVTGAYNISKYPSIFRALDPSRAVMWFVRTKDYGALAGVLLALTGCEAMFANLGHFNALSIQISFPCFVYPSICLAYLGQGARLIVDGDSVMSNIFFTTIPGPTGGPLYWIVFVVSILATLIASQTLITATFSLVQQLVNFKSLPPLRLVYTNGDVQGQVYVPAANYILGIATVVVVGVFQDLAAMTNAYGFAVATVMIVTSSLIAIQIYCVKHLPLALAVAFFACFVFFDGLFWGASLQKVPHGAWVPLMIGSALLLFMVFWTWARGLEAEFDGMHNRRPSQFLATRSAAERLEPFTDSPGRISNVANCSHDQYHSATIEKADQAAEERELDRAQSSSPTHDTRPAVWGNEPGSEVNDLVFVDEKTNGETTVARLPTAAVFLKMTADQGVPHAFYRLIEQMPALPRLVIFLSLKLMPVAHVNPADRLVVTRVRSISGFYGVMYRIGFRDVLHPSTEEMVRLIAELETRGNPSDSTAIMSELKKVSSRLNYIVPHYDVTSKDVDAGFATSVINLVRRFLIESVYRRLRTMFPDTANWALDNEDLLRVGVNASI